MGIIIHQGAVYRESEIEHKKEPKLLGIGKARKLYKHHTREANNLPEGPSRAAHRSSARAHFHTMHALKGGTGMYGHKAAKGWHLEAASLHKGLGNTELSTQHSNLAASHDKRRKGS